MNPAQVRELRVLCTRDSAAKSLAIWAANQKRIAKETTIEDLSVRTGLDRASSIELAKSLDKIGIGRYIVGRRGKETRVEWVSDLKIIASAALGHSEDVSVDSLDQKPQLETDEKPFLNRDIDISSTEPLTIPEAKRRLAFTFGVPVDRIDITVRG